MVELQQVLAGMASSQLALKLVHPVLIQVVDASKSLSRKVILLVVEGLLEVVEVGWLELLESLWVVQTNYGGVVPLKKSLGVPFAVVGGAFFAMVLSEAGHCGSCSRNAPCTCGGAQGCLSDMIVTTGGP